MKKIIYIVLFAIIFAGSESCKKAGVQPSILCSGTGNYSGHPKADVFNYLLNKYTQKGLPGISLLVKDASGIWAGSAGQADIAKNTSM